MFRKTLVGACALIVTIGATLTMAQAACLGVSRTINISSFKASMGANPSGGIGLRHKEVVLTFDDGPIPGTTARVLSALSAECTKATFFMVGNMARANPGLVRKVARAGHTIGHHTINHSHLPSSSHHYARMEIQNGVAMINKALGPMRNRSSRLFRYPYLARNASLDKILRSNNLLPFSANIDSTDWKKISPDTVVNRVMSLLAARGRGVILMHDIQPRTASALPVLLDRLKANGYKVVHVRTGKARTPQLLASRKKNDAVDNITTGSIKKSVKRDRTTVAKTTKRTSIFAKLFNSKNAKKPTKKAKAKTVSKAKKRVVSVAKKQTKKLSWLERRRKAALARAGNKASKKKSAKKSSAEPKKSRFSFFRNAVKRKPGESMGSYHHRVKQNRAKMAKK